MICACLLYFYLACKESPPFQQFIKDHIVDDDPWDRRRPGPWGLRPEDPDDWGNL